MSKMVIYFCLFIPLLFLSGDSSSIRGRNHKNDLVPFLNSRFEAMKRDPNSLKVVSKDPFIIQLHMPNSKETEARGSKEKDKKRKRPVKKRISKIKPLRKKHRKRRDLLTSKTRLREEKPFRLEIPRSVNNTERQLKNNSRNPVSRVEILKALSSYPQKTETKRNKLERIRNLKDEINTGKTKKNNVSNRNLPKHHLSLSDRSKLAYPSTPKLDRRPQKYTYKDLMADRKRLEQKINYIKNMLNANVTATDDGTRVRRRSDSDRAANKIAKMFLTLSAVNGLNDRKKSKCRDDDDDDEDRVDVWQKERRNNPLRKSTSSNEERYKVKKWIEFLKNKRSSGKTCPCMRDAYGDESEAFPLEQKLPKGYFLLERGRSSEESSESYPDPHYYSRDKINRNDNFKKRLSESQDQDNKNKAPSINGKRRLEVPFEDLELYRSRARQILRNAEEILDKIKEEEEKRVAMPSILMSQLKELTARIHGDPRNNENDLIQKIQKNLGWGPLATPQEDTDGTFLDNVKSLILDPYEKAKALTDESTKKLSSYLLRNLGKLKESSEEQEMTNAAVKTDDESLKIYLGEVPDKEGKPASSSLTKEPRVFDLSKNKEDLKKWEDTLSAIFGRGDDAVNKENKWDVDREESYLEKVEDMVNEAQKKLNDFKDENSKDISVANDKEMTNIPEFGREIVAESKPESILENEKVAMTLKEKEKDEYKSGTIEFQSKDEKGTKSVEEPGAILEIAEKDSDSIKNQPFRGTEGTNQGNEGESIVQASPDMQEEEEKEIVKMLNEKGKDHKKQDSMDFQVKNGKYEKETKNVEGPGAILEKTEKDSDPIENQPFRGTKGTNQGNEGESIVQASPDMQEEEEKEIVKMLNEKLKDSKKQDITGLQVKKEEDKKEIESSEKPAVILEKTEKDSDPIKNQPFRGIKGTNQGNEGESIVQASPDMQEEEEKEIVKILTDKENDNESPNTDIVAQKSNAEEKARNEDIVAQVLEKQEEHEKVNVTVSPELVKIPFKEGTLVDSTSDEKAGKKSDESFPSITLFNEASPTDSGFDSPGENVQKENVKADFADEFESNEEPVLEKQRALGGEQNEDEMEVKGNKSENFKEDAEIQTEKDSPLVSSELLKKSRKEYSSNEEITEEEIGAKTLPEYADLVNHYKHVSEVDPNEEDDLEDERRMGNEEVLGSNNEETTRTKNTDGEMLKGTLDKKENILKELEKVSREDSTEDINTHLKATLDQENSNQPLDERTSQDKDDGDLLKETKPDEQKNESLEESIKEENLEKSQEILAKEKNDETLLSIKKPSDESQSNIENTNLESFLKESNPSEAFKNVKESDETPLGATVTNKDQDIVETQENLKESLNKDDQLEKEDEMNLKASLDKDEDVEKDDEAYFKASSGKNEELEDDEMNLKASLDKEEDLEKVDEENLKASLDKYEELEKGDVMNLKANLDKEDDLEKVDEENLKASLDKYEELEKGDVMNLKANLDKEEDLEKVDEENFKASSGKNEELEDDEMNLKASLDKEDDLEKVDEENLKASLDKYEELEKGDVMNLKANLDKEDDLEKVDEENLKASLGKYEELEKGDVMNLNANLDKEEDLEKVDEENFKASSGKNEELEDDEMNLKASLDKEDDLEKVDEENLKASLDKYEELEKGDVMNLKANLEKGDELEKDDEMNLKASLDKDEDLEKDDGIILKASNRYGYDDIQNLSEEKGIVSQKGSQENDYQRESTENVENVLNTQKDEKPTDIETQRENLNQKIDSEERGIETLEKTKNTQETQDKENEKATVRLDEENQNAENLNEKYDSEAIVKAEKLDENVSIEDEETSQELLKSVNNKEMEDSEKESDVIKEANTNEDLRDEKMEILEEILRKVPANHRRESEQVDEDEQDSNKSQEVENLEAVLKNETPENMEERPDEKILKVGKVNDESQRSRETSEEASSEDQDKDAVLKEENIEASEENQDDLEEGENVKAVFDNQDQFDEVVQNFDEDKRDMDDEKIMLKEKNFEEELNPNDETLKAVLNEHDQENLENYKKLQESNYEEVKDKTPLRSASLEDEFDNKIDYDTPLKSAQSFDEIDDLEFMKNFNGNENEDTLRAYPQNLSHQVDEENEEEAVLKSANFDTKSPDGNGYSYETVMEDNVEAKSPSKASNREDADSQENFQQSGQLELQKPDSTSQSLKASKLKVPKWIGKIMKDLNGKEKTDITSMQNLNPDKIDDMLGKIGKAEQQNLLESEEVDCRKECACAEEMNKRSRNIGRYEIVKDFLHWVKDLQLNRVLSDE